MTTAREAIKASNKKEFSKAELLVLMWKAMCGEASASPEEVRVYEQAGTLFGFSSDLHDEERFNALLIFAMAQTLDGEGRQFEAKRPVHFFIPGNMNDFVKEKTLTLGRRAIDRLRPFDTNQKEYHRNLIKAAIGKLVLEVRPWRLEGEPPRWVAFGFKKESAFLPAWLNEKLIEV